MLGTWNSRIHSYFLQDDNLSFAILFSPGSAVDKLVLRRFVPKGGQGPQPHERDSHLVFVVVVSQ